MLGYRGLKEEIPQPAKNVLPKKRLSVLSTRCFAFVCLFVTFNDVFEFVVLWVEKQEVERNRKMVVQWFVITDDVMLQKENICASCLSTNHKCIVFACC